MFVYTGRGGFGYLKQWKWWAGLILSKSSLSYHFMQPVSPTFETESTETSNMLVPHCVGTQWLC